MTANVYNMTTGSEQNKGEKKSNTKKKKWEGKGSYACLFCFTPHERKTKSEITDNQKALMSVPNLMITYAYQGNRFISP